MICSITSADLANAVTLALLVGAAAGVLMTLAAGRPDGGKR